MSEFENYVEDLRKRVIHETIVVLTKSKGTDAEKYHEIRNLYLNLSDELRMKVESVNNKDG